MSVPFEEDRRIFTRFQIRLAAKCIVKGQKEELYLRTLDLGADGIGVLFGEKVNIGDELEIWLHIPNIKQDFYTHGSVVWIQDLGQGEIRSGISLEKADLMGISLALREVRENHKEVRPHLS